MALLGKRKARAPESVDDEERQRALEAFRRHFEAQFAPLPESKLATAEPDEDEDEDGDGDDSEDEEWGGGFRAERRAVKTMKIRKTMQAPNQYHGSVLGRQAEVKASMPSR